MSTIAETPDIKSKRTISHSEAASAPHVALFDEQNRIWGFFAPVEERMLNTRTPQQWFAVARTLIDQQPKPLPPYLIIPFETPGGDVRGKFYLNPWSDEPTAPLPPLAADEQRVLQKQIESADNSMSIDEFFNWLDEVDGPENGK